jgi:NADH-quinone oxidoreductase subunit H
MAISSLGVYGIVLAGYASNNKYSLLGGLRSSAQLISYELAMGMSLASIVMFTGSLRMSDMVNAQEQPLWGIAPLLQNWFIFTPFGFVSFVIFMICMVAETNRAPFDLPEAENEIIAGYHTEYSSMKFAVFFMGEYAAMFMFGMIASCVFLGGYNMLPINWNVVSDMGGISAVGSFMKWMNDYLGPIWLIGKGITFITIYIWIRATLPRLRYDQLMSLGWKSLLPISVGNFIVVAIWILFVRKTNPVLAAIACCLAVVCLYVLAKPFIEMTRGKAKVFARRRIRMVSDPKPEEGGAS